MTKKLSRAQVEAIQSLNSNGGYRIKTVSPTQAILCERGIISIRPPSIGSPHGMWVTLTDYGREIAKTL